MNNRGRQNNRGKANKAQSPWQNFLAKLQKDKSPLYEVFKDSVLEEQGNNLMIIVAKEVEEAAKSKRGKLQSKLVKVSSQYKGKKLFIKVGNPVPKAVPAAEKPASKRKKGIMNPLQALNHTFYPDKQQVKALQAAAKAETTCNSIYTELTQRTKLLADEHFQAEFTWRLRVGGMRGFDDLLLPVFHPVYGVPYVPSSSLKGALRAWMRKNHSREVNRLLGSLDYGIGCVQILDAFPVKPCLSVDMANPQWHWREDLVKYDPQPHALLSMEEPELLIGLTRTSRGNLEDVQTVRKWLEQALGEGIGSRVSAGYGRTQVDANLPHSSSHNFQLWTQGMYGASKQNPEFRPTALRGILRYWFRAIALGLYSPPDCKTFENEVFGTIEPSAKEGKIRIGVDWEEEKGSRNRPYFYEGSIILEAKEQKHLTLIEKVLYLASHLGGIGRGSRRPLHWNSPHPGLRGCYWEIENQIFPGEMQAWQDFLQEVTNAFTVIKPLSTPGSGHPGDPGNRKQDVLNNHARIYLVPSHNLKHPKRVTDWQSEGEKTEVRGKALDLLYKPKFKGVSNGTGNANVGGNLGTPSYVWIQNNFPTSGKPYQAVTIFGANQRSDSGKSRSDFVREIIAIYKINKIKKIRVK